MIIDLSKCKKGQELLTSQGRVLTYVGPLHPTNYYDHEIVYEDGGRGTRTNEGFVFRHNRRPETDNDIIEILEGETGVSKVFMICDAYESGVGKGMSHSKFKEGPFARGSDEQEAYKIGYVWGENKAKKHEEEGHE